MHCSPTSCVGQPFLGVWVLHVDYETLDFSGDDFVRGAMLGLTVDMGLATVLGFGRILHIFYVDVGSDFGVFLHSHAKWRSMLSRCFDLSPCTPLFALGVRTLFLRAGVLDPA